MCDDGNEIFIAVHIASRQKGSGVPTKKRGQFVDAIDLWGVSLAAVRWARNLLWYRASCSTDSNLTFSCQGGRSSNNEHYSFHLSPQEGRTRKNTCKYYTIQPFSRCHFRLSRPTRIQRNPYQFCTTSEFLTFSNQNVTLPRRKATEHLFLTCYTEITSIAIVQCRPLWDTWRLLTNNFSLGFYLFCRRWRRFSIVGLSTPSVIFAAWRYRTAPFWVVRIQWIDFFCLYWEVCVLFTRLFHFCPLGKHVFDHFPHFVSFECLGEGWQLSGKTRTAAPTMIFSFDYNVFFLLYTRPGSWSSGSGGNDVINFCFGSISDANFFLFCCWRT